jgi:type I restriction enzyme M protein
MTEGHAAEVVDRLWRAYLPFQRGRNTSSDLPVMLTILLLARFVDSVADLGEELAARWKRAAQESRLGNSPLKDLYAAVRAAGRDSRFPVPDLGDRAEFLGLDDPDGMPWLAAFLAAMELRPTPIDAGWSEVCDLLFERHIREDTRSTGEFHTPRVIADLLAGLVSPQPGDRILDPACGTGGLLAAAARRVAAGGHSVGGASFDAFAMDRRNLLLATLNLAIHGVERPVVHASTLSSQLRNVGDGLVDRVMSNPPFNQRIEDVRNVAWPFGEPPESNANFAWLQLAWTRLSRNGIAAMIMPPGATWAGGREAEIRKRMISKGALLGIVALPPKLFIHTAIPVHIWLLSRADSSTLLSGDADTVLFIDASLLGTRVGRRAHTLGEEAVIRVSGRFHQWLHSSRETPDEPGFSRSVAREEILDNGGNLDPRRYVGVKQEQSRAEPDAHHLLNELDRWHEATAASGIGIREDLDLHRVLIQSAPEARRTTLHDIVNSASGKQRSGLLMAGPSGSLIGTMDYVEGDGIPIVMPKDLSGLGFNTTNIRFVSERKAAELARFRLRQDDIVMARRGDLGRCAVVRSEQQGWICGTGCFVLRPPEGLDSEYFAAYFRSSTARAWLEAHSTGSTTMKTISLAAMRKLPIVLPNLAMQQVIAGVMVRLANYEKLLRKQLSLVEMVRREALGELLSYRPE